MLPFGIRLAGSGRRGDATPLLLLHGLADDGGCWPAAFVELGDRPLVATDAPGHGCTPLPLDGPDASTAIPRLQARQAGDLLEALGVGPVDVCGHSMGAAAASLLALERPALVRRLVLEDPPWWEVPPAEDPTWVAAELTAWVAGIRSLDPEAALGRALDAEPHWPADELAPWIAAKRLVDPAAFSGRRFDSSIPWRSVVSGLRGPVLLLTGDPGRGAIVTPAVVDLVVRALPGVFVSHHPTSGHSIRRDDRPGWVAAVRAFLDG